MSWFKSKKQKALEKQEISESVILEAANKILYKKDVEKGLQAKINTLTNEVRNLDIENKKLTVIINTIKEALK